MNKPIAIIISAICGCFLMTNNNVEFSMPNLLLYVGATILPLMVMGE